MNKLLYKVRTVYVSNLEKYIPFGRWIHIIKKYFFYKQFNAKKKTENKIKNIKDLKVGFITTWNTKCGIAIIPSKYLVKELINRRVNVIVLSEKTNLLIEKDENFVRRCWSRDEFDCRPIIEEIKKNKINLVHIEFESIIFNNQYMFLKFLDKLDKMEIRVILSLHIVGRYIDKYLDRIADVIIIHNPEIKRFIKNYEKIECKIHYLNLGVPLIKDEDRRTTRKYLKIKSNYVVASSGFMANYKNFIDVIKAIGIVKKSIPDILYILASSKHPFYPSRERENIYKDIEDTIKNYKLVKNFLMIKDFLTEKEKFRILHAADILISYNYTQDLSQGGAVKALIASKRPVITSDNLFHADMNKGVLKVKENSPKALAEAITKLFKDKEIYNEICEEGKQFIKENNFKRIADKYIKLYTK